MLGAWSRSPCALIHRLAQTRHLRKASSFSGVSSNLPRQCLRSQPRFFLPTQGHSNFRLLSTEASAPKARIDTPNPEPDELLNIRKAKSRKRSSSTTQKTRRVSRNSRTVTAYCAAEQYDLKEVARIALDHGYQLDPHGTKQHHRVVHIQIPIDDTSTFERTFETPDVIGVDAMGDVFIFPSGTIVGWDVPEELLSELASHTFLPAAQNPHIDEPETEDLEYLEDPGRDTSSIKGDTIILGTKAQHQLSRFSKDLDSSAQTSPTDVDKTLVKIAFSWGLARSTKLAVLESLLEDFNESTRTIPTIMSRGDKLAFSRTFVSQKIGQFLTIRAQLNLSSDLTDSLPDLFWDTPHELGLEGYFDRIGRALDISIRIRDLNDRLDYSGDIVRELKEQLNTNYSEKLERIIIILIAIEIIFGLSGFWQDVKEWIRYFAGTRIEE